MFSEFWHVFISFWKLSKAAAARLSQPNFIWARSFLEKKHAFKTTIFSSAISFQCLQFEVSFSQVELFLVEIVYTINFDGNLIWSLEMKLDSEIKHLAVKESWGKCWIKLCKIHKLHAVSSYTHRFLILWPVAKEVHVHFFAKTRVSCTT